MAWAQAARAATHAAGALQLGVVADPFGRVLARASATDEETLLVECDLDLVESVRRDWPFLRDRRIDAYDELGKRFRDT